MAQEREIVDITQSPDLMRVAEEVRRSKTPRVLRAGDEDVAVVMPVAAQPQRRVQRVKTEADYEAFLASAGSWSDVDVEGLKHYLRQRRDTGDRPPVEL